MDLIAKSALLIAVLLPLSTQARAQSTVDYCITCVKPEQTYICRLVTNGGEARGQQLFCIMNIAQQYNHESCAVSNQQQTCSGALVQYEVTSPPVTQSPPVEAMTEEPAQPPTRADEHKNGDEPPGTLVEFSKKTVKDTEKGLKKVGKDTSKAIKNTGEKVGNFTSDLGHNIAKATKKTVKCVTSLFSNCQDD